MRNSLCDFNAVRPETAIMKHIAQHTWPRNCGDETDCDSHDFQLWHEMRLRNSLVVKCGGRFATQSILHPCGISLSAIDLHITAALSDIAWSRRA